MDPSMSTTNVPAGISQPQSSMPSIDDLLHNFEACSAWKIISMPNLTALCHEHKCNKCSIYLGHLLLSTCVGELCTHPTGLEQWQDHVWPTTMNNIHKDVSQPLTQKLNITCNLCDVKDNQITHAHMEVIDLCDKPAEEHRLQHRLEDYLAQYKGKQRDNPEAMMGSPSLHKHQVAGDLLPSTLLAVYMPVDIPAGVDILPPKWLKDDCGVHIIHDPMEDMFNRNYTSE